MKAKKSYGQHFLIVPEIAGAIADGLVHNDKYDQVLEVGPGTGLLTEHLVKKDFKLKVVEADRDMVNVLVKRFKSLHSNIIPADFLKLDLNDVFQGSFALIGNFPYNISSQIIFKMLEYRDRIPEMVGMFQKEVAARIVAGPGSKTYGVISVLVQAYYEGEYLFDVDKSAFDPPPKVQSGVIRLVRKEQDKPNCDMKLFKRLVKQAFSQRRKMLRNTMKTYLKGNEVLNEPIFSKRPEALSLEDFIWLTNLVERETLE